MTRSRYACLKICLGPCQAKHEMTAVCPGTWRVLHTGLRGLPQDSSALTVCRRASILYPLKVFRPSKLCLSSTNSLGLDLPTVAGCPAGPLRNISSTSIGRQASHRNFSTNVRLRNGVSNVQRGPVKQTALPSNEISSIFGKKTDPSEGNRLLQLVQEQRLAGTIDEEIPGSQLQKQRALAWLRKKYPVDEERAILDRLEREEEAASMPNTKQGQTSVYGEPVIERIRKENIAKRAKREEEERAKKEAEAKQLPVSGTTAVAQKPTAAVQWVERYRKKAEEAGQKSVPQMSFIQRVAPATLMTVAVVSLGVMFAQNYSPPSRAARLFPDVPPAAATIGVLIGMNFAVWLAWRVPPLLRFMNRVFVLSPVYPYASSIVANNLSHQALSHLGVNMVALWFVGTSCKLYHPYPLDLRWLTDITVHEDIGRGPFLATYIACGAAASYIFLVNAVLRKNWVVSSVGCSGAVCGLIATWFCINSE